jgi:phenylalanyl-tRNA synthetase beta chain
MFLSVQWLREFVPYEGNAESLADRLTMLGLEVEEIVNPFARLQGFVVGHVQDCRPHSSSDHLSVCRVDIGAESPVQIVCGAPNVAAGQKVPVAPIGTVMPNGMVIKKVKLRGEASHGMICSETEMEMGADGSGIMVLAQDLRPGLPLMEALALETEVLDVDITPNRGDCLSVLGLAREVAMAFDLPLRMPSVELKEQGSDCREFFRVEIDDPELCLVYQGRCIRDVQVGPSPDWIRYRLLAVGIRPISNVVDVTNYILMELGQPLHAFDQDLLRGGRIRVARAEDGMRFTTLDGQERKLLSSDLLIHDGERPVGLAGVMGGLNSEITDKSRNVFLESAVFHPATIRKTARRLALPSEASYRFERGVDHPGSLTALNKAAAMMAQLAGGRVLPGVVKDEPRPFERRKIRFRPKRARAILALDVSDDYCLKKLKALGCEPLDQDSLLGIHFLAPSHRPDLEREADLIEEVGRIYGLDRIPVRLPQVARNLEQLSDRDRSFSFGSRVKDWAMGCGLSEVVTYSFVASSQLDFMSIPDKDRVRIMNPLSEDMDVLRPEIAPGLLNALGVNMRQGQSRVRIFEVAHVFSRDKDSETQTRENNRLGILLAGPRNSGVFPFKEEDLDYTDIKGLAEHLQVAFRIQGCRFEQAPSHHYLSPGVFCLTPGGEILGLLGRFKKEMARSADCKGQVWFADFDLDLLEKLHARTSLQYENIPKFPLVRRDATIIAPSGLTVGRVLGQVKEMKIPILEDVSFVDLFIPDGGSERHLTLRMVYRHQDRTLRDKEVDKMQEKIVAGLVRDLGVRLP